MKQNTINNKSTFTRKKAITSNLHQTMLFFFHNSISIFYEFLVISQRVGPKVTYTQMNNYGDDKSQGQIVNKRNTDRKGRERNIEKEKIKIIDGKNGQ